MTARELKKKYFDFFIKKGHKKLPNVSLIPEDISSSALFISAGMHPLVPYLLGELHPSGKRLVSNQRCIRTGDIEEVGDPHHLTFFEMLGNWSLGDPASPDDIGQGGYWKEETISWSWDFLIKELEFPKNKFYVTCFKGDKDAPKDEESAKVWQELGIPKERIFFFDKKENWWGPIDETGPCGPDTEMFVDTDRKPCGSKCDPSCQCGKYFEVWNDVFMEYNKTGDGKYEPLKQKNVDTGMGVERVLAIMQGQDDIFLIDELSSIIRIIEEISGKKYEGESKKSMRITADHLRAATFIISDGVIPSNKEQGYVLRRLIRRAIRFGRILQINKVFTPKIAEVIIEIMKEEYPDLEENKKMIFETLELEENKFQKTLSRGLKEIEKQRKLDGKIAFYLYETYGFPLELTEEIAQERGQKVDKKAFEKEFQKHQKLSRAGAQKKFAGGLADHSEGVTKLHTATHLLQAALRKTLGEEVFQKGSNITAKRLRFDFSWQEKLTPEQIKEVEDLINQIIKKNLPLEMETMSFNQAKKKGAVAVFGQKYGDEVKTYRVGSKKEPFSFEVCGGPHVDFTGKLGKFKIIKQEAVGSGIRRLYAILE
jgi:alanyl-tRNA synthetase